MANRTEKAAEKQEKLEKYTAKRTGKTVKYVARVHTRGHKAALRRAAKEL